MLCFTMNKILLPILSSHFKAQNYILLESSSALIPIFGLTILWQLIVHL
jgi:hypothetical protein